MRKPRNEDCGARAKERTGSVPSDRLRMVGKGEPQARARGVITVGTDVAVADKAQDY